MIKANFRCSDCKHDQVRAGDTRLMQELHDRFSFTYHVACPCDISEDPKAIVTIQQYGEHVAQMPLTSFVIWGQGLLDAGFEPCSSTCTGWAVFNMDTCPVIQACDECNSERHLSYDDSDALADAERAAKALGFDNLGEAVAAAYLAVRMRESGASIMNAAATWEAK